MDAGIREVLQKFFPGEEIVSVGPHGSGHINHTFAVETAGGQKYILQKINVPVYATKLTIGCGRTDGECR